MSGLADSLIARMVAQRDLLQEMTERSSSISAHVVSADQSVSVEVDGRGAIVELWLSPEAVELEPDALAKLVVDTAAAASDGAIDHQNALFDELNDRMRALKGTPLTRWDGTTIEAP